METARTATPVVATSWRRHGPRRQRAARIARLLRPTAHLLGALVSTELTVPHDGRWYRPDVGVQPADKVPPSGVLACAPVLVVRLGGPLTARDWMAAGASVVWTVDDGIVMQVTRAGVRRPRRGGWLRHPTEPALRLAVAEMADVQSADSRIGA